ncbi:MAG: hypothetical protein WCI56_08395 [Hyphomicrobiales bacterium]
MTVSGGQVPAISRFTPKERRLIARLRTPELVQRFLSRLPYNVERKGETLRSFRQVVRHRTAHCLEAALFAACVLEQHGYPPLVMGLESADYLDHILFVYRKRGRWGAVARSRDPGLHGRKPVFRSVRALALSYFDAYVDYTGAITGYALIDLRKLGNFDWRFARRNMWSVERFLTKQKHKRVKPSRARVKQLRRKYIDYRERYGKKPLYYRGREAWTEIPKEFL